MKRTSEFLETVANVVSAVVLGFWVLAAVAIPVATWLNRPIHLTVPVGFVPTAGRVFVSGQAGASSIISATGMLRLDIAATAMTAVLALIGISLIALPTAWGLHLIGRVLSDVVGDRSLRSVNADRLRNLGAVVLVGPVAWALYSWIVEEVLAHNARAIGLTISPQFRVNGVALFAGGVFLVFSAVWRHAALLQSDADLTV